VDVSSALAPRASARAVRERCPKSLMPEERVLNILRRAEDGHIPMLFLQKILMSSRAKSE